MDLIQWDKSALSNLMGNTNGNTEWLFGYLDTDQLVPLMDAPTSLDAYQHFARHCISCRRLSLRSINGTTINPYAGITYADVNRIFHHRGTLDLAGISTRRIIPTNQYVESVTEANWSVPAIPFYANAFLTGASRVSTISTQMTTKFVYEFAEATNVTAINYAHATTSVAGNRPDFLQVEYKVGADWIALPDIAISATVTSIQTLIVSITNAIALRVGARKSTANTGWLFDILNFDTLDDKVYVGEAVQSLVVVPMPIAEHPTPPIWGSGNVRVFAFDLSELKMNTLTTDRFVELGIISSRLDAKAVVL